MPPKHSQKAGAGGDTRQPKSKTAGNIYQGPSLEEGASILAARSAALANVLQPGDFNWVKAVDAIAESDACRGADESIAARYADIASRPILRLGAFGRKSSGDLARAWLVKTERAMRRSVDKLRGIHGLPAHVTYKTSIRSAKATDELWPNERPQGASPDWATAGAVIEATLAQPVLHVPPLDIILGIGASAVPLHKAALSTLLDNLAENPASVLVVRRLHRQTNEDGRISKVPSETAYCPRAVRHAVNSLRRILDEHVYPPWLSEAPSKLQSSYLLAVITQLDHIRGSTSCPALALAIEWEWEVLRGNELARRGADDDYHNLFRLADGDDMTSEDEADDEPEPAGVPPPTGSKRKADAPAEHEEPVIERGEGGGDGADGGARKRGRQGEDGGPKTLTPKDYAAVHS